VQIKNLESMNVKKENQLWNQTRNPKLVIFSNIEKTIATDDWSSSDESSGFCMPFINCSSDANRTVLVFIVAIFILCCCCTYQFIQCRQNNDQIRSLTAPDSKWFAQKKNAEYYRNFNI